MTEFTTNIEELPADFGAYVLKISLDRTVRLTIPRFDGVRVIPGVYAYVGSANGPGGIRARCRRHLLKKKKRHWHVDHLTTRASRVSAAAFPFGNECKLADIIQASCCCEIPVPGFGSSDCPDCSSHLLRISEPGNLEDICFNNDDITGKAG